MARNLNIDVVGLANQLPPTPQQIFLVLKGLTDYLDAGGLLTNLIQGGTDFSTLVNAVVPQIVTLTTALTQLAGLSSAFSSLNTALTNLNTAQTQLNTTLNADATAQSNLATAITSLSTSLSTLSGQLSTLGTQLANLNTWNAT